MHLKVAHLPLLNRQLPINNSFILNIVNYHIKKMKIEILSDFMKMSLVGRSHGLLKLLSPQIVISQFKSI